MAPEDVGADADLLVQRNGHGESLVRVPDSRGAQAAGQARRRSASCGGMRKRTFSVTPGRNSSLGPGHLAQPRDQLLDQDIGSGGAGGDADRARSLEPARVERGAHPRSDSSARRIPPRSRAAGSSSSCSARRPRERHRRFSPVPAPRAAGSASRSRCPWCPARRSTETAPSAPRSRRACRRRSASSG